MCACAERHAAGERSSLAPASSPPALAHKAHAHALDASSVPRRAACRTGPSRTSLESRSPEDAEPARSAPSSRTRGRTPRVARSSHPATSDHRRSRARERRVRPCRGERKAREEGGRGRDACVGELDRRGGRCDQLGGRGGACRLCKGEGEGQLVVARAERERSRTHLDDAGTTTSSHLRSDLAPRSSRSSRSRTLAAVLMHRPCGASCCPCRRPRSCGASWGAGPTRSRREGPRRGPRRACWRRARR